MTESTVSTANATGGPCERAPELIAAAVHRLGQLWLVVQIGNSYFARDERESDTGPFSTSGEALGWVLAIVPTTVADEVVEAVAKAIEGPFDPVPEGSKFSLIELREVRWNMLTESERQLRRRSARAAIAAREAYQ